MRIAKQEQIAATIQECAQELRTAGSDADVLRRLEQVESELRPRQRPQRKRKGRQPVATARRVAREAITPRLGRLDHHAPRPLMVPSAYARTRPPRHPPTVSVVTPSYNQAHYIERTMMSVLGQRYPALEYIVQDAASTDGTAEVLAAYAPSLTACTSEKDAGQADGINRGFERSTGEIMAYLNSDDLLLPGAISYVTSYFQEHPEVDAVYGHRILIDDVDRRVGSWICPPHDARTLLWADFVPQETLFWRRSIWERVGGHFDISFAYAMDWDLLLRFAESGARFVRLPRLLGAFRVHPDQKTTATHDVGEREVALLRRRSLGRAVTQTEVMERVTPYLRRHVASHLRHRAHERAMPGMDVMAYFEAARRTALLQPGRSAT